MKVPKVPSEGSEVPSKGSEVASKFPKVQANVPRQLSKSSKFKGPSEGSEGSK